MYRNTNLNNQTVMELAKIKCKKCYNDMPKLRKDLYGYLVCVNCSDVKPVVGRVIVIGEGDHTATELEVMDQDTAQRIQNLENQSRGIGIGHSEVIHFDDYEVLDTDVLLKEVTNRTIESELVDTESDEDLDEVEPTLVKLED